MNVCKYHPDKRCYHSSCDFIDDMGNVSVCPLHLNPSGFFVKRKYVPILHGVFDKHGLRRK